MIDEAFFGINLHGQHIDEHFLTEAAFRDFTAGVQHTARISGAHVVLQGVAAGSRTGNADLVFQGNLRQRRIGGDVYAAGSAAFGFDPHDFVRQHIRVGRGHKCLARVATEIVRAAGLAPHAAVEHQPAVDMDDAFVAQLLLKGDQSVLVEHGVAAAYPVDVALQRIAVHTAVAFQFGRPAVIPAQCAERGKGGYELHGRGGVHRFVCAVFFYDPAALQVFDVNGYFFRRNTAEIQSAGIQR